MPKKIASTAELETELRRLLAYSQSEQPSRALLAQDLSALSDRLISAASGQDLLYQMISRSEAEDLYERLATEDAQSAELFHEVMQQLGRELTLSAGATEALNRAMSVVENRRRWNVDMLRNVIFKAADAVGMRLPSHFF